MAQAKRCDNCDRAEDGSLEHRVRTWHVSPGHTTYEVDLCAGCEGDTPIGQIPDIGRRAGTGHAQGTDIIDSLDVELPE